MVPMLNPDGCYLGNYRADSTGVDLNRFWGIASHALEPSLHAVRRLAWDIHTTPQFHLALFLDIHAHSASKANMCYCNAHDTSDSSATERNTRLLRLLESRMLGFSFQSCVFDSSTAKAGCARRVIGAMIPDVLAYTLEISFFVSKPPLSDASILTSPVTTNSDPELGHIPMPSGLSGEHLYNTEESYLAMGEQVAQSLLDWFAIPRPSPKATPVSQSTTSHLSNREGSGVVVSAGRRSRTVSDLSGGWEGVGEGGMGVGGLTHRTTRAMLLRSMSMRKGKVTPWHALQTSQDVILAPEGTLEAAGGSSPTYVTTSANAASVAASREAEGFGQGSTPPLGDTHALSLSSALVGHPKLLGEEPGLSVTPRIAEGNGHVGRGVDGAADLTTSPAPAPAPAADSPWPPGYTPPPQPHRRRVSGSSDHQVVEGGPPSSRTPEQLPMLHTRGMRPDFSYDSLSLLPAGLV